MTTQKIEFEYTARNEQAGSRAWQEGRLAIDGYNRELTETNAKARQAAESMTSFGNKGRDVYLGLEERQKRVAQGIDRLRIANQHVARDAFTHRQSVMARSAAMYESDAARSSGGFASSRTAARRNASALEFQDTVLSAGDLAGLAHGDRQRSLATGSMFRGKASGRRGGLGFDVVSGMAGGARSAMGGLGLAVGGGLLAHKMMQVNNEMIENADNAAEAYDTLTRSLNVQAGLSGAAAQEARQRILKIAFDAAADKNFAFAVSTQLVSSGFSAEQATGGALKEMLKGVNAMPAPGGQQVDPIALTEAAVSYLTSQNMEKTETNLSSVLAGVQHLYKSTNFQLADFAELAPQADVMRGSMTTQEQFAAFSVLRDVGKTAEEATTALRAISVRSQTAELHAPKTAALQKMGLTPEDIDLVGESFTEVLDRLAEGLKNLNEAEKTSVLTAIYEERGASGAKRLIDDRQKVKDRAGAIGDQTEYEANAKEMSSGVAAAKRRQAMQAETFAMARSKKDDLLRAELKQNALENGSSPLGAWMRDTTNWALRGVGVDRDTAAGIAFDSFGGSGQLESGKMSLAEKGVDLSSMQIANPKAPKSTLGRLGNNLFGGLPLFGQFVGGGEADFIDAPQFQEETAAPRKLQSREDALKAQPNFDSLPRPGGAVKMENASLERGTQQQVTLLSQLVTKMNGLISVVEDGQRQGSGGREPRRASSPWDPRRPPPLPPIVSLSASEVS